MRRKARNAAAPPAGSAGLTASAQLTDVPGLLVGHVTHQEAATGCTVVLGPAEGMRAAGYIRGRATGTREFDALSPHHIVPRIHAVLLAGGSAFGLGAADGVMHWLREKGRGFPVGDVRVPIVPTAVVFDLLPLGRSDVWPTVDDGYAACEAAGTDVLEGSVGAGTGATVGKILGHEHAMKGGVGNWSLRQDDLIVGALAVVNALGDVRDRAGVIIAGARDEVGFADTRRRIIERRHPSRRFGNTTLVVVGANAELDRRALREVARAAADGLVTALSPAATAFDGDVVFALTTGGIAVEHSGPVELLAQEAVATAIERAVRGARGTPAVPGLAD